MQAANNMRDADVDIIGAHVFEIKPNTPDNIARGQIQAQGYMDGLRAEIEQTLRSKGKAIPAISPRVALSTAVGS